MGIFDKMFGSKENDDDQPDSMPWDERPSIYDHVRSHIDPSVSGLSEGGETLPDDERVNAGSRIRWAAGAMDGVATHHMGTGDPNEQVQKTVKLVKEYCAQPTAVNKAVLYREVMEENTVSIIDHVIEAVTSEDQLDHQRLYELTHSFVTEANDREPVKFGSQSSVSLRRLKTKNFSKPWVVMMNSRCSVLSLWPTSVKILTVPSGHWRKMSMAGVVFKS